MYVVVYKQVTQLYMLQSTRAKFDGHIYNGDPVICKSISPLQCIMGVHCCCLHVKYTDYKHFGRSLQIGSLDPT